MQQARHLGAQSGWWILAGGRDNIVAKVKRGNYLLHTMEEPYPDFKKGHKDPNKPLIAGNIIPQCQKCNQADRNRWVYDDKGRVIKLAKANFILNSDPEVIKQVYQILYKKFKDKNPNEK